MTDFNEFMKAVESAAAKHKAEFEQDLMGLIDQEFAGHRGGQIGKSLARQGREHCVIEFGESSVVQFEKAAAAVLAKLVDLLPLTRMPDQGSDSHEQNEGAQQ